MLSAWRNEMLGHKFYGRSVTISVGLQIRTTEGSYYKLKFLRQFETVNTWILNLKGSLLPAVHKGLWTLMLIDHKWFALVISESSWETPDLEVLVAKKSWFNWVKAKEMGFDLEAACQDRLYLMSPRSCGQAFSRQKWSQDQVLLLCVHWSWGRLAGQCPGQQLYTAENCSRNEKWS